RQRSGRQPRLELVDGRIFMRPPSLDARDQPPHVGGAAHDVHACGRDALPMRAHNHKRLLAVARGAGTARIEFVGPHIQQRQRVIAAARGGHAYDQGLPRYVVPQAGIQHVGARPGNVCVARIREDRPVAELVHGRLAGQRMLHLGRTAARCLHQDQRIGVQIRIYCGIAQFLGRKGRAGGGGRRFGNQPQCVARLLGERSAGKAGSQGARQSGGAPAAGGNGRATMHEGAPCSYWQMSRPPAARRPPFNITPLQNRLGHRNSVRRKSYSAKPGVDRAYPCPGAPCARRIYLCWNAGGRFSTNAAMPSFWSAVENSEWNTRRSNSTPSFSGDSYARLTHSLAIMTEGSDIDAMTVAASMASSSSLSAGTTRETRPARSASSAFIRRAVSTRSMALALPTARGRRCVPPAPGMTPSLISGWPKRAESAAMMMSHIMASSQPPPRA